MRLPAKRVVAGAAALGIAAGVVSIPFGPWQSSPLIGWDVGALAWAGWVWGHILGYDPVATNTHATRDDPSRTTADLLLLGASVASLVAVLMVIVKAAHTHGDQRTYLVVLGIVSIVVSWSVVHTIYTLRYAALYYEGPDGGVDFNDAEKPSYTDFAYMAFTIGMTYQVSDTNLQTKAIRHTALRHALLSYLFGTVIVAATINLIAGLAPK
jgi:uncharacterized membrane protein